jgi:hypothetical protein
MTHKNRRRSSYASWILISKTGIACPQPKIGSCSNNYYRILTICMSIWREFSHKSIPVFRNKNRNRVARMATILVCVSFSAPKSCHPPTILLVMLKRVFSPNGPFKGTVSQDFLLLVFFAWISFPPSPEYPIRTVSNFLERRYLQVKVHHRYQWHRWQICPGYQWHWRQILPPVPLVLSKWYERHRWQVIWTVSDSLHLKVNLKEQIYLYVNSTIPKVPKQKN